MSSILVARFGCRPVMLVGGLLASAGMVLASFATRLLELYLTAGVLTGEGARCSPPLRGCGGPGRACCKNPCPQFPPEELSSKSLCSVPWGRAARGLAPPPAG